MATATRNRWLPMRVLALRCFEQRLGASTGVQHNGQPVCEDAAHCGMTITRESVRSPEPSKAEWALSANIAVELPEAVKDGTLYRVLFLAALVLFATTFVINTAAEMIRQRFRLRAVQL